MLSVDIWETANRVIQWIWSGSPRFLLLLKHLCRGDMLVMRWKFTYKDGVITVKVLSLLSNSEIRWQSLKMCICLNLCSRECIFWKTLLLEMLTAHSTFFMPRLRKDRADDYLITASDGHFGLAFKININDKGDFLCVTIPLKLYSPPSMLSSCWFYSVHTHLHHAFRQFTSQTSGGWVSYTVVLSVMQRSHREAIFSLLRAFDMDPSLYKFLLFPKMSDEDSV